MLHRPSRLLAALTSAAALALALVAVPTGAVPGVPASPAAASVSALQPPVALPPDLEPMASYVPADSCEPAAKTGVLGFAKLLVAAWPVTSYGISRPCGTDPLATTEHYEGRALDWFTSARTTAGRARAQAVIDWLFATDSAGNTYANARRLGIMYVIWNNRIWGAYRADEGWRPYLTCADHPERSWDTTCHRNHMHFSFTWEGARGATSFWTGQVAAPDYGPCRPADLNWASHWTAPNPTPCTDYPRVSAPAGSSALTTTLYAWSGMWVHRGSTGPVVSAVQQALGLSVDGTFGASDKAAVGAWQSAHGLAVTGAVNPATWRALLAQAVTADRAAAATSTTSTTSPLTRYLDVVLRRGDHGRPVAALQRALHLPVTRHFGPRTVHRVKRFQRHHHLRATGVVRRSTWRALGA